MATLNINGKKVTVDDSFLSLPPEQQEATVNEIASSFGPDRKQEAMNQRDKYYSSGIYAGEYNPLGSGAKSFDAATSMVGDALTLGFGDEAGAAVSAGVNSLNPWGRDAGYSQMRDEARALNEARNEQNPWASTVGSVSGGLMMGSALPVGGGSSLLGRMGYGAGEAVALGGLYGVGSGEDAASRITGGLQGAARGLVIGGLAPAIIQGVSSVYRNLADRYARRTVAEQAGINPDVASVLARTMEGDGTLGAQGIANMNRAGQEAMLVDAGPNARAVLDTSIQRGGPGAVLARGRIDERLARDSAALGGAMDNALGTPQGVYAAQNEIRSASRPAVTDAYKQAFELPIDYSSQAGQQVEDIINRIPNRIKSQAIQRANERMKYEGRPNQQIMADIAEDGAVTFRQMPNVEQADSIKKSLDEIARDGTDVAGKMSSEAAFSSRMARDLRDAVGDAVPEYKSALSTAADPLRRQAAIETGSSALSPSVTRDQFEIAVEGMTSAEKREVAQGIRSTIDDTMSNVRRTMQDGNTDVREAYKAVSDLSSRANRSKVEMVIGKSEADKLFEEVDRVAQSFNLRGSLADNSKTFARNVTNETISDVTAPGMIGTAAKGEPINAGKRIVQALTGQTPERLAARQDALYSEISDVLTRPSADAINIFNASQNFAGQTAANQARSMEVARLLSMGRTGLYPVVTGE